MSAVTIHGEVFAAFAFYITQKLLVEEVHTACVAEDPSFALDVEAYYVDDLLLVSKHHHLRLFYEQLSHICADYGFTINKKKTEFIVASNLEQHLSACATPSREWLKDFCILHNDCFSCLGILVGNDKWVNQLMLEKVEQWQLLIKNVLQLKSSQIKFCIIRQFIGISSANFSIRNLFLSSSNANINHH